MDHRWLAAALTWARTEPAALARIGAAVETAEAADAAGAAGAADAVGGAVTGGVDMAARQREPSTADLRSWARADGLAVPDRGRLRPEIRAAWNAAHRP